MSPLQQAGLFLVRSVFELYIIVLMLRFLLQLVRADFHNPISILVVKLTNPILVPLRRIIPGFGGLDIAAILLLIVLNSSKVAAICWLQYSRLPQLEGIFLWCLGDLVSLLIHVFFFAILIQVILSWVSPYGHNPMAGLLQRLTSPLMGPARRIIPSIGGFDITPIPVMIFLQLLIILAANPLTTFGMQMSLR